MRPTLIVLILMTTAALVAPVGVASVQPPPLLSAPALGSPLLQLDCVPPINVPKLPGIFSPTQTSLLECVQPILDALQPTIDTVRDCVSQLVSPSTDSQAAFTVAGLADALRQNAYQVDCSGVDIQPLIDLVVQCVNDATGGPFQLSAPAAGSTMELQCPAILPIIMPLVQGAIQLVEECVSELTQSLDSAQESAILVPQPDCHIDPVCDTLIDTNPVTVCDIQPCNSQLLNSNIDCPPKPCETGTGYEPVCLVKCSTGTGYVVAGVSVCEHPCPAEEYGAQINSVKGCVSLTSCSAGGYYGYAGYVVDGEPICAKLCEDGYVGAYVDGTRLCVPYRVPEVKTCAQAGRAGTGYVIDGTPVCVQNCPAGSDGVILNDVSHCYPQPNPNPNMDTDGDGYTDTAELTAGSNLDEPASTPYTDDDHDGKANYLEYKSFENQDRALCTGAYGVVGSSNCGGYGTPSGTKVNGNIVVDSAKRVWVWDGTCEPAMVGSYDDCTSTSNYSLNYTPYSGTFGADGYGWRMVGKA